MMSNRMAAALDQIGLFPLGVVLFPGAYLPLHIFEQRYRALIRDCIEQQQPFGINLLDNGELHLVGCTAHVHAVLRQYSDGRLDIVVRGERRYILQSFDDKSKPYYVGTIEYFDDHPNQQDIRFDLYQQCAMRYNSLVERVFPNPDQFKLSLERIPVIEGSTPSYFMAQKAGLKLPQKQILLSMQSENERLKFLIEHLEDLLPRLDRAEQIYRVAQADGYLIPDARS